MNKLNKGFYQKTAFESAPDFLGKYLVYNSDKGKISGRIVDVEAYPANFDNVSHGNKRTKRTEVMYKEGGFAYIYLIYGKYHQFAIVVNKAEIPEVVFIRAVIPEEGIETMKNNFGKEVKATKDLTGSPGNLCKAFGIDLSLYGENLTGEKLYIEDRGKVIKKDQIKTSGRIGINKKLQGWANPLRFVIK